MILLTTPNGKYFFSSFLNLNEETSGEVDENTLNLKDLKYILTAKESGRLIISELDLEKINNRILILNSTSSGGGEGVDPSLLLVKEDKSNKVSTVGTGSDVSYPNTNAVKTYVQTEIQSLNLTSYAKSTTVNANLLLKADKTELSKYALATNTQSKLVAKSNSLVKPVTENRVPLYTLGTDGSYVLCTPNAWIHLGDNMYMPAYSGEVLGLSS